MAGATKAPTALKSLMQAVQAAQESQRKHCPIERQGDKIIIPEGMSYKEAHEWLTRQENSEETLFKVADFIDCFPLDGMVALARAIDHKFGFMDVQARDGFFGPEPPIMVQVPTATGFETAFMGKLAPPKWEGGYLQPQIRGPQIYIAGQLKRKFEPEVKEIIELTRNMLKERSIYKGQAMQIDLHWWEDHDSFDVINDAPKFIDLAGGVDLILNKETEFELGTSVYMILEQSKACRQNGIKLKHGALFKGPFGTGKTLCARVIASKAVANGWTYIYLKEAAQLAAGLRVAKLYAPAVVFAEDVDTVVANRDDEMNNLLNTLDGVDTKADPIMVILTTNKADEIDPSFLRAGRIDSVIHFGEPDAEAAIRFVHQFGKGMVKEGENLIQVGKALAGLVPAFVFEAVSKAKRYAIFRTGKDQIAGDITADDLLQAAKSVKDHIKMMQPKGMTPEQEIIGSLRTIHAFGVSGVVMSPETHLRQDGILVGNGSRED